MHKNIYAYFSSSSYFSRVNAYYSHFIGHLLSRYRRISDCLYSIVAYGQAAPQQIMNVR